MDSEKIVNETSAKIAELNDKFRGSMSGCTVTKGVAALAPIMNEVFVKVRDYDAFTEDNDPYGEHDFGSFVASVPLTLIPILNILAVLSMFTLQIWGLVDFFLLKDRKTDESGKPLATTSRDERFIKYLVIYFIVAIVLAVLVALIMLVAFIVVASTGINALNGAADSSNFDSSFPSSSLNSI